MEKYVQIVLGLFLIILGAVNISGNISTIHWYNRTKVQPQDVKKYGRCIGIGTVIIGFSIIISNFLSIIFNDEIYIMFILLGSVIGLIFMLYAQFKYNKGIF